MNTSWTRSWSFAVVVLVLSATAVVPAVLWACPFCSAVSMTLGEELKASDAAVIATLVARPAAADPAVGGTPEKSKFKITKVLKGEKLLENKPTIDMLFFGTQEPGATFLIFGVDPKEPAWGTPNELSAEGLKYIEKVAQLAETPAERLAFFQEYFENPDQLLSGDAFNEFAKAPYSDVVQLKDKMHRDKLIEWIKDDKVPPSRRRLYLTMLGMCGTQDDVPMIEAMIKTDDRQVRTALDAMIGCYLNLRGADGLPLIEEQFLKNDKSEYVDTYSAIVALRVLGQETNVIPKEKLVSSLRHMLDRPQLADLVIPDLARWQDWGSMDKLVDLFKNANDESSWVRVPVVQFLRACPEPKAKEYIDELAKIDPDAVKRATNYLALPGASGPAVAATAAPAAQADASTEASPASTTSTERADAAKAAEQPAADKPAAATNASSANEAPAELPSTGVAAELAKDATAETKLAAEGADKEQPLQSIAAKESPYKNPYDEPYDPTKNYEKVVDKAFDAPNASKTTRPSSAANLPSGSDWGIIAGVVTVIVVGSVLLFRR
ncbi:MAG TPA: hypothetical protein VHD36_13995 [Pirellulales bacterium]|nr:hypothetical protein [Pirellulales bacterium]